MNTQSVYSQSELALAAYATLNSGSLSTQGSNLRDSGKILAGPQAVEFATRYTVVTQYTDTLAEGGLGTSFSATVFKDVSGSLTLAIRGTADFPGDYFPTDADVIAGAGRDQIVAMWNWWQRASMPGGQAVAQVKAFGNPQTPPAGSVAVYADSAYNYYLVPAASSNVTANGLLATNGTLLVADADHKLNVTGHSLGGHLAMAFSALFPTAASEVAAFNAPGFKTNPGTQQLFAALGGTIPSGTLTTNVIADEASIGTVPWTAVAGLNSRPGTAVNIAIENQWLSDEPNPSSAKNHSQQILADSLAVFNTLVRLDTGLTTAGYKSMLSAAALGTAAGYERVIDALEAVFNVNQTVLSVGNGQRDALYTALYSLRDGSLMQQLAGKVSVSLSGADLANQARTNFGTYLSLSALSPIVISTTDTTALAALKQANGALAQQWEADSQLSASQQAQGIGNFTNDWLTDRAGLLQAIVTRNIQDNNTGSVYDAAAPAGKVTFFHFTDPGSPLTQTVLGTQRPGGSGLQDQHILFGTAQADALTGYDVVQGDHLYGDAGNDTLNGLAGNDYLEGGKGTDTYQFAAGSGQDIILDTDGLGQIRIGATTLTGGNETAAAAGFWLSTDGAYRYVLQLETNGSQSLLVYTAQGGDRIQVRNFQNDALGIHLQGATPTGPVTADHTIAGDLAPLDTNPNLAGVQVGFDALGNLRLTNPLQAQADRPDTLYDSSGNDLLQGLGDDDNLIARVSGADRLEGGAGNDYAEGGTGDDTLVGGTGTDILVGGDDKDTLYGTTIVDTQSAIAAGRTQSGSTVKGDWLNGGKGDDVLIAGADNDAMFGGAGADLLVGGAGDDVLDGDDEFTAGTMGWTITAASNGNIFDSTFSPIYNNNPLTGFTGGADVLFGGNGNDRLYGLLGDDLLYGEGGNDTMAGDDGDDILIGGAGNDLMTGDYGQTTYINGAVIEQGDDYLDGGDGDDDVRGEGGDDVLFGGLGADTLTGDTAGSPLQGADSLDGEDGNDLLFGGGGADDIFGGAGNDSLYGDFDTQPAAMQGNDFLDGQDGDDVLLGAGGDDSLFGGAGQDVLQGGDGADILLGESGFDTLDGDFGDDTLIGGTGSDTLHGGEGDDTYVFNAGDAHDTPLRYRRLQQVDVRVGHCP